MTDPSLREALDRVLADMRTSIHTCFPAQVLAYDAAAQTVDLRPAVRREVAADEVDVAWGFEKLPDLLAVPVQWSRTGGHGTLLPIEAGDWMMVLCAEQSLLLWRSRGTTHTTPGINDPHGLNGCCAIPGWFPDERQLKNVSATDMVVGRLDGTASARFKPDGTVVLGAEDGAGLVALAEKVDAEFQRIWDLLSGAGSPPAKWVVFPSDGGAALATAADLAKAAVRSVQATQVKAR